MSSNTRSVVQITQKLSHENRAKLFQNKRQIFGSFLLILVTKHQRRGERVRHHYEQRWQTCV
jgi:hypothetical protein